MQVPQSVPLVLHVCEPALPSEQEQLWVAPGAHAWHPMQEPQDVPAPLHFWKPTPESPQLHDWVEAAVQMTAAQPVHAPKPASGPRQVCSPMPPSSHAQTSVAPVAQVGAPQLQAP